jgi:phosphatidylglycerophosphatase A
MIWTILATWFGSGLSPKAPGTCGSLAALPFAVAIIMFGGSTFLIVASIVVFLGGIAVSDRYMAAQGTAHDPGEIVIDEVAGQWIALIPAGLDPLSFFLAFVFFRLFDIWKPWPIRLLDEKVEGGLGVMVDDVVAGIFAATALWLVLQIL